MTYPGNLDTRAEMRRAMNLGFVETREDAAEIGGEGREHFGAFTTHAHEADGRLWVYAHLDAVDDAHSINLGLPSGRSGTISRCDRD